jgi:hypothetical protein
MQSANAKQNPSSTPATPTDEWQRHEHVSGPSQIEAQHLVDAVGSAELAKHAVDAAAEPTPPQGGQRDEFAKRLGFGSYLEMFESAEPIQDRAGATWLVSSVDTKSVVWSEQDLEPTYYNNRDDAVAAIESGILGIGVKPVE